MDGAIPTRVGKSADGDLWDAHQAGHPHAGGEIDGIGRDDHPSCGPSPRGWGNQPAMPLPQVDTRAIPTRVGKSLATTREFSKETGHPHAGGEIRRSPKSARHGSGPSPRGWGNPPPPAPSTPRTRAIPTRVGKSTRDWFPPSQVPGHPHAGGEICRCPAPVNPAAGPSPRGWGNPPCTATNYAWCRAIPTRVGKSVCLRPDPAVAPGHPHAGGEIP